MRIDNEHTCVLGLCWRVEGPSVQTILSFAKVFSNVNDLYCILISQYNLIILIHYHCECTHIHTYVYFDHNITYILYVCTRLCTSDHLCFHNCTLCYVRTYVFMYILYTYVRKCIYLKYVPTHTIFTCLFVCRRPLI